MDLKLLATVIVILVSMYSGIAVVDALEKCFGSSRNDFAYSINQTDDGGYIAAGATESRGGDVSVNYGGTDAWVIKLNSTLALQWEKSLGGSNTDIAYSVFQTKDGGNIVAGSTDSSDFKGYHGGNDAWVVKLGPSHDIQWQRCLGGSDDDFARSIQPTNDGGYILAGYTYSNNGNVSGNHGDSDVWVIKLDSAGWKQWQKCLGGRDDDRAYSIQQTKDGGYILASCTDSIDGNVTENNGGYDGWAIKLNSTGGLEWQKCLGSSNNDYAFSIRQTNDGSYIVAGYTYSDDISGFQGTYDAWIAKLNSTGELQWQKCLGGTAADYAYSIQPTIDGGYILVGATNSNDGNVSGNHGMQDYWAVKLNSEGDIIWQECLGGKNNEGSDEKACSILQTADGSYVLAGSTSSNDGDVSVNHGGYDVWVVTLMPPVISAQPVSQTICAGQTASFKVIASGTGPLSYQWKKNGSIISGATTSSLSADGAGIYIVEISNKYGNVTSSPATLTFNKPVSIVTQPASQNVCEGKTVSFSVTAIGTGPLSYQWKKGGTNLVDIAGHISEATTDTFAINGVTKDDAGDYTVVVSGVCENPITSSVATLKVYSPPLISNQPVSTATCLGGTATFSVAAAGTDLAYQWYKGSNALTNGGHISGATGSTITISSADNSDIADYYVVVSGLCSSAVTSNTVHLTVNMPPSIITQPESMEVCLGAQATFTVEAIGTEPLYYQWLMSGSNIPGATDSKYSISCVERGDAGTYTVAVSDACGTAISKAATINLIDSSRGAFKFRDWGHYKYFGFLADKYFGGYIDGYLYYISRKITTVENMQLGKVLMDDGTERTITTNAPLRLQEGYELDLKSIDTDSNKVYLELSKNGEVIDSKVIQPMINNARMKDKTYYYMATSGDYADMVQIAVHFKSATHSANTDIATVDGIFQIAGQ